MIFIHISNDYTITFIVKNMLALGVSIIKELGRGTSGVVYQVQSIEDGSYKVVKTIDLSSLSESKQLQASKEVEILKRIDHPHIIKYYNSIVIDAVLYILMEYAAGGDLQSYITETKRKRQHISENQVWAWAYEISLSVYYLHGHKILHRDLKCLNIFLDCKNRIKIGDLGLSEIMSEQITENKSFGTPLFMSPEQIRRQPYGFKVDIWGIGCIIYTLCTLDAPFIGDNFLTLGYNITTNAPKAIPPRYSPNLQSLVNSLLEKDQSVRPHIKETIKMIPTTIRNRYRKPENIIPAAVKTQKIEPLPLLSPNKRPSPPKLREGFHSLIVSARKFNPHETPDLPRSFSRNLDKSRSRATVNDLYNI